MISARARAKSNEKIAVCQANLLGNLSSPIDLTDGYTVELCQVEAEIRRSCEKFLVFATVNWQVVFNFTGVMQFSAPGFAQITFNILRNGHSVYEVIETVNQPGAGIGSDVTGPVTVPVNTGLLHFENISGFHNDCDCPTRFSLQASNIILTPPVPIVPFSIVTSANATAVTLVVSQLR